MENKINEIMVRLDDLNYRLKKYRDEVATADLLTAVNGLTDTVSQLATAVAAIGA